MNVKSVFTVFKILNVNSLIFGLACAFLVLAFHLMDRPDHELLEKQTHLVMRSIGHDLMSAHNNTHTPISPISRIDEVTLRLILNESIAIDPEKLLEISSRHLNPNISNLCIVNVLHAETEEVVYGFEINFSEQKNIPCLGRTLPKSDYWIDFSFYDQPVMRFDTNVPMISFLSISLLLFAFLGFSKVSKKSNNVSNNSDMLNGFKIDSQYSQITFDNNTVRLTDKEMQISSIFFKNEGKLVSREYLIEEVWLKKGIVTGRSLDMYISRLRKKIGSVSKAKIINQHGKGYIFKSE